MSPKSPHVQSRLFYEVLRPIKTHAVQIASPFFHPISLIETPEI